MQPALHDARYKALRTTCHGYIQQIGLTTVSFAIEHGNRLPRTPDGPNRLPWDFPWETSDTMASNGLQRQEMYDPAFRVQNDARFWNAAPGKYHTVGYAFAFTGPGSTVIESEQNRDYPGDVSSGNQSKAVVPNPSRRVLVADAIISRSGENDPSLARTYHWRNIPGGVPEGTPLANGRWEGFATSHLRKADISPLAGNVGMLDGHAEWRSFADMLPRTAGTNGTPIFWW
jgi:prepilin-type processing-associated H-X9-DG protein